ncbi:unnamed protein product [Caretta caretta]
MESGGPQAGLRGEGGESLVPPPALQSASEEPSSDHGVCTGFEEAVAELSQELGRLAQNLQALTHYQATLLSVNKSLCSWMENINELSKHRKRLPIFAAPGK